MDCFFPIGRLHVRFRNPLAPRRAQLLSERYLTAGYVMALSLIAALTIASHLTLNRVLAEHEGSAEIVNVSGRQRMLSQRIASLAAQYRLGSPTAKADLLAAIGQFEAAHHKLLADSTGAAHTGPNAGAYREIYFGGDTPLDGEVATYVDLARRVAAMPQDGVSGPVLEQLFREARSPLLAKLDAVVSRHQQDSEQQLSRLEFLQRITLGVVLATLAAEALVIFRPMVRRVTRYARELMRLASTDGLTGTLNRHSFLERGAAELGRAQRRQTTLAVLMLDADHFKRINDTYGHAGGDAALRGLAQAVIGAARASDLVGRLGGEEFALLLPETTEAAALLFAQRLRADVEGMAIPHGDRTIRMTVSIGIAGNRGRERADLAGLLREADAALYEAKAAGRNRVVGAGMGSPVLAWANGETA